MTMGRYLRFAFRSASNTPALRKSRVSSSIVPLASELTIDVMVCVAADVAERGFAVTMTGWRSSRVQPSNEGAAPRLSRDVWSRTLFESTLQRSGNVGISGESESVWRRGKSFSSSFATSSSTATTVSAAVSWATAFRSAPSATRCSIFRLVDEPGHCGGGGGRGRVVNVWMAMSTFSRDATRDWSRLCRSSIVAASRLSRKIDGAQVMRDVRSSVLRVSSMATDERSETQRSRRCEGRLRQVGRR
mmetsp:Transcript_18181/g.56396  ORF Transcript_18181/g.56396 Transcript_18181/m.56396 type:complete len:246 (+) Transcript_18181:410-1147(+)